MLDEIKFTDARKTFTQLFDNIWHRSLPAIVKRKQAEEVVLLRRDLQQFILQTYDFKRKRQTLRHISFNIPDMLTYRKAIGNG